MGTTSVFPQTVEEAYELLRETVGACVYVVTPENVFVNGARVSNVYMADDGGQIVVAYTTSDGTLESTICVSAERVIEYGVYAHYTLIGRVAYVFGEDRDTATIYMDERLEPTETSPAPTQ